MARVHVDPAVYELHGQRVIMAPEIFRFADDGSLEYDRDPVGSLVELAEAAAGACPSGAITIEDADHVQAWPPERFGSPTYHERGE